MALRRKSALGDETTASGRQWPVAICDQTQTQPPVECAEWAAMSRSARLLDLIQVLRRH